MYSLTFNVNGVTRNTWNDWHMIPDTPPMIPYPELNTNYVDIPGRSGGPLDLTGVPFGKLTYKRMTGSWNFIVEPVITVYPPSGQNATAFSTTRTNLYETLCRYFAGRVGTVTLVDHGPVASTYYYKGRFSVGVPRAGGRGPFQIQIGFDLEPRRYFVNGNTVDPNYAPESV